MFEIKYAYKLYDKTAGVIMKYLKLILLYTFLVNLVSLTPSNSFFDEDMVNSLTKSLEEAAQELSDEMENISNESLQDRPSNNTNNNSDYIYNTPAINEPNPAGAQTSAQSNSSPVSQAPQDINEVQVEQEAVVTEESTYLFTPMGRDITNVLTYELYGSTIILDSALFLNNSLDRFIEDIDGNLFFQADVVKVGVFLAGTFSTEDGTYDEIYGYTSIYDQDLNDAINQRIFNNVKTLEPNEYFNFKPYEFETLDINIDELYYYPYGVDNQNCLYTIMQNSAEYDLIVAPVSCFYSGNDWIESGSSFDYLEFYSRDELLELVMVEKNNQAIEYQKLVENNPNYISWLDIPPADGDDWGNTCTVKGITNLQADAAIISRWEGYYSPIYFSDINSLFIEVTQKREYNCNDLLLTLADKERLKKALDKKTIKYKDDKTIIEEQVLTLQTIDNFYDKVQISDEEFYNFFADYGRDDVLFEELLKNNIDTRVKLDNFISNVQIETPNYSLDTNQDIYDYLLLKEEASIRGLSVSALIDEQNKIRQEAEAKAAEQNRIARQEYLRDYPFYAKISCNMFGSQYSIILCFSGEYTETTITLEANGQSREKKFYNFTDLGYYEGDTLVIDLPRNFNLSAQNASDDATLTVEVYDRETNELLHVDEASSLFGIAGTYY